jgi:hypothetical protein
MRGAFLICLLLAGPSLAGNPELAKAEKLYEAFKYPEAEKALVKALALPDNDRATVVRIWALRGIVDATQGKKSAVEHFRRLVAIDPEHSLSRDLGPRILQPFYEAKARLDETPAIKLEATATLTTSGQQLKVAVKNDTFGLGATLRFFWRAPGGEWKSRTGTAGESMTELVPGTEAEYRAELLNSADGVLMEAGTAGTPLKADEPRTASGRPMVEQRAARESGPGRKAGIALAVVGGACLVGALTSGIISTAARGEVENPRRDENGMLVGITPERAKELESRTVGAAVASNLLLVTGLVAAVGGTALIIFDPGGGAQVQVAPAAGGVVVNGRF